MISRAENCFTRFFEMKRLGLQRVGAAIAHTADRLFSAFESFIDPYAPYPQNDTPPSRLLPFMWAYCRSFRTIFIATALSSVLAALVEIGLLFYMARLVDLLVGDPARAWASHGCELVLMALFVLFVRPLMMALNVLLLNQSILPNLGTLIRWRAHRHVLRQSVGWFENDFAGRIANRVLQTPPAAGDAVFQVFDALTFALAYVVGAALLLAQADARLMLPLLLWLGLYALLVRWTMRHVGPASQAAADARSEVTGRVVDSYTNIHSVKMFASFDHEATYARESIDKTRTTFAREMRIFTSMDVMLSLLNGVLVVTLVGWAVYLWMNGQSSTGIVAAASALALRLNAMTGWIMWALSSFFRQIGVVREGMETIAQPITLTDKPGALSLRPGPGRIELRDVSHHYGRGSGGLDNISLTIEPGEKVGLIGRSGAGKSTLVKLLLRFYDMESGRILIDGQAIDQVSQASLRKTIGMVGQESTLLHRSVYDNIRYGSESAGREDVLQAARRAEAHEFILDLEDQQGRRGYEAQVGERGVKLSGGQRQRISLARVMLKDAPILVLDEATSALDSEVEAAIQSTLYGMMEGKTVIAIAHRLSTIAQMDRILVLENGRIAEEGTHNDLIARGGLYAGFWARQSGGFLDLDAPDSEDRPNVSPR